MVETPWLKGLSVFILMFCSAGCCCLSLSVEPESQFSAPAPDICVKNTFCLILTGNTTAIASSNLTLKFYPGGGNIEVILRSYIAMQRVHFNWVYYYFTIAKLSPSPSTAGLNSIILNSNPPAVRSPSGIV